MENMKVIEHMLKDVPLPRMVKVRQHFDAPELPDTEEAVRKELEQSGVLSRISPGDQVAIASGSRGIADISIIIRETVRAVKRVGGEPFIIPAMGSHGGATAEGQRDVLEQLGVTREFTGALIRASMDVVELAKLDNGLPVYVDKYAYEADKVIVVNRIKPHTAFRGPYESGLMKMITIGLGKQKGAEAAHAYSFKYMAEHIHQMSKITLSNTPIIFGLAVLENAYDRPAKIEAVPAELIEEREPALLLEAKSLMPKILFDPIDVLVVKKTGKDISGDGMDPNITGRFPTSYADGGANVTRLVVLELTERTHGNAAGIGQADVTTKKLFDSIKWEKGYANAITSTVLNTVRVPMVMPTEELAMKAAIKTCNAFDMNAARVVRLEDTLHLKEIWISESLLPEATASGRIEILTEPQTMEYENGP